MPVALNLLKPALLLAALLASPAAWPQAPAAGSSSAASSTAKTSSAPTGAAATAASASQSQQGTPTPRESAASAPAGAPSLNVASVHAARGGDALVLSGTGDVVVVLEPSSSAAERAYTAAKGTPPQLFVNGIALGEDARLLSIAPSEPGGKVPYHFQLRSGKGSQSLWAYLYDANGLTEGSEVNVGVGWSSPQGEKPIKMAISSRFDVVWATFWASLIVALLIYAAFCTDAMRDASLPVYVTEAIALRGVLKGKSSSDTDAFLKTRFAADYDPGQRQTYADALTAYQRGMLPPDAQGERKLAIAIALATRLPNRSIKRATFSLSRTQLALWFTFALCAGIFLWVARGDLPPIDGSLLMLLGISVATASAGQLIGADGEGKFQPSRNLLLDLVTGPDGKQQIHRLQSVAANLLLLIVGFIHVKNQLTYPIFDSSWLYFLGISGTAYAAGKQLAEVPK